jgi:hypothetical protein
LNQQLHFNLIALKTHYQSLLEQCERDKAHASEQLDHVQALLVGHLPQNQGWVESLNELRRRYQGVIDNATRQAYEAKEQLIHINALLADQLVLQYNQQQVFIQASTVNENPALPEAVELDSDEFLRPEAVKETLSPAIDKSKAAWSQQESTPPTPELANVVQSKTENSPSAVTQPSPESKQESRGKQHPREIQDTEPFRLLPKYSNHLSFIDAVATVLKDHPGEIMTPMKVMKTLFGELSGIIEAKALKKVQQALWDGASRNHWQRLPGGVRGRYTLERRLEEVEIQN